MSPNSFWQARPHLATIYQYAQARRVGPWAVLGTVLARVAASTSPSVQLPPLRGGYGTLNLFVGIVAPSGGGKGASQTVGNDVLNIYGGEPYAEVNAGSGEGIVAAYVRREQTEKGKPAELSQYQQSVLFNVQEVDTLKALGSRQGSTLTGELRKMWSGEALGFQNADETRRLHLAAHTYRAALIVGVQPGRGAVLLDDVDGGLPQRFIWLPATDPQAPRARPSLPEPIAWTPPRVEMENGRQLMNVAQQVRDEYDENTFTALTTGKAPLDGHAMYTRLKVAAALALLDGRATVFGDDWELAQVIMGRSDQTRAEIADYLAHAKLQRNAQQAIARGHATAIAAETADEEFVRRARERILKHLQSNPEGVAAGRLKNSLTSSARKHFEPAITHLETAGQVTSWEEVRGGNHGTYYGLTPSQV